MKTISANSSLLLVIDVQDRLLPAINESETLLKNILSLLQAAPLFDVPILLTEQNVKSLGGTTKALQPERYDIAHKMHFDSCREADFLPKLHDRQTIIVSGSEAHVCVLQTVLGLLQQGRHVVVIQDAIGSRTNENKKAAIQRMQEHGAEIVTTEMVLFEWLATAEHPQFKDVLSLIK